ncbi:hypothetical protein ElyMa_001039800 [Elysia marginata]|uniref:Ig-like domain-containing protein n=1 Tax=Elysia marginata TaxID=1093978 RepID=A0AAV4HP76_9GAST|nr:hypothetical protein ElyMa_001039800 [Elysia marginata]
MIDFCSSQCSKGVEDGNISLFPQIPPDRNWTFSIANEPENPTREGTNRETTVTWTINDVKPEDEGFFECGIYHAMGGSSWYSIAGQQKLKYTDNPPKGSPGEEPWDLPIIPLVALPVAAAAGAVSFVLYKRGKLFAMVWC